MGVRRNGCATLLCTIGCRLPARGPHDRCVCTIEIQWQHERTVCFEHYLTRHVPPSSRKRAFNRLDGRGALPYQLDLGRPRWELGWFRKTLGIAVEFDHMCCGVLPMLGWARRTILGLLRSVWAPLGQFRAPFEHALARLKEIWDWYAHFRPRVSIPNCGPDDSGR